jgi:PHD/YefM family antitoxin component YafN of YafNO toxin-antitoxin module
VDVAIVEDPTFLRQIVGAFLKVFDDIKLKDDAILQLSAQNPPNIVVINEAEFNKRVAEHEANRQRIKRIGRMLDKSAE